MGSRGANLETCSGTNFRVSFVSLSFVFARFSHPNDSTHSYWTKERWRDKASKSLGARMGRTTRSSTSVLASSMILHHHPSTTTTTIFALSLATPEALAMDVSSYSPKPPKKKDESSDRVIGICARERARETS